jgi:GT2 family glycosyltransferase
VFSILIPSWNNLPYLQACVRSIRTYSSRYHEIIVHCNEGSDGTLDWLIGEGIKFTQSNENIGICKALNMAATLATTPYICYMNDDMFVLPDWDIPLKNEIDNLGDVDYMISATCIEPRDSNNPSMLVRDYGNSIENFREDEAVTTFRSIPFHNWSGSFWPPNIVRKSSWDKLNGFDEDYSPGMASDDDFAYRLWLNGCRYYKGIAESRVYHFACKSTHRIKRNNGRKTFFQKHGIGNSQFQQAYLKLGKPFQGMLKEPVKGLGFFLQRLKYKIKYG